MPDRANTLADQTIEQARARGLAADRIAADLGLDLAAVLDVFARMDAALDHIDEPDVDYCGTIRGYNQHRARKEPRCAPCRAARRLRIAAPPGTPRTARPLKPCGTHAAYKRHKKAGEPACAPCRAANSRAVLDARRARGHR